MIGLSYLPTAQRLSFSILKANSLRFEEADLCDVEHFSKYSCYVLYRTDVRGDSGTQLL